MDPYDIYAEKYRLCVLDVAKKYISHLEKDELINMKQQFEIWKKEPDKLNVNNLYTLSGWRALYTQNLFMSRISTMLLTFRQVLMQPHVFEIMKNIKRVVSIGCGPGPDIAAVLMLLRNNIGVSHFIKVIGIDQFIGWRQYVLSLNKVDLNGTNNSIEFWQLRVEEKTLDQVLAAEMCVMSYTDAAIHTQRFWQGLKQKFSLIVILDQKKGSLTRLLRRENFRMVEYEYKGTKRFFYWVDPRGVKESLSHINARLPTKSERLSAKTGVRINDSIHLDASGGKFESTVSPSSVEASSASQSQVEEEGDDDDDDDDDDNSEQQRELAAIFDRLGDIGKMPVAQLNELDEVQKIRNELCRTADAAKDSTTLAVAVKPKQSYRSALEPQKHLSKERKNQLLKAKLRELGVTSDDDDDSDESDESNEGEAEGFSEIKSVDEVDAASLHDENDFENDDELSENTNALRQDIRKGGSRITPLSLEISDRHTYSFPKNIEEGLPILCVSSVSSPPAGNTIPTVDRLNPAYSPPIIIPPLNIQTEQSFQPIYPVTQTYTSLPAAYPILPQFSETIFSSTEMNVVSQAPPLMPSRNIRVLAQSHNSHRSQTSSETIPRAVMRRGCQSLKRPNSLVLLSNGSDDSSKPYETGDEISPFPKRAKKVNSCLGSVESNSNYSEVGAEHPKTSIASRIKPVSFNRAAEVKAKEGVTDLRQLLNIRRKNKSDP